MKQDKRYEWEYRYPKEDDQCWNKIRSALTVVELMHTRSLSWAPSHHTDFGYGHEIETLTDGGNNFLILGNELHIFDKHGYWCVFRIRR